MQLNEKTKPGQSRFPMKSMLDRLPRKESRRPRQAVVEGYCLSCREVTVNDLIVVGNFMKARRCRGCGRIMRARHFLMAECYVDEFVDRLGDLIKQAKPSKVHSLGIEHLLEIPRRTVRKALQEVAYVTDLLVEETEWPKDG